MTPSPAVPCVRLAAAMTAVAAQMGCGLIDQYHGDCDSDVAITVPTETLPPISLGLRYLALTQFDTDQQTFNAMAYAGDWPQCFTLNPDGPFIRDTNPFMAAFIHHALTFAVEEHQRALQLSDVEIEAARAIRRAAVGLMLRFRARPDAPDAGTFAFWPYQQFRWMPGSFVLAAYIDGFWRNWRLHGVRAPLNVSFFPPAHAIPSDADDTALVYPALLDHATLDAGPTVTERFERFFADWRNLGQVPRSDEPTWLGPDDGFGAYLTWLAYLDDPTRPKPNEADVVVNANILYALGRYGRLDTPGVADAVNLINDAVDREVHLSDPQLLSFFYPDNFAFHYCVIRACYEGGVSQLAPAADGLVEDLLMSVDVNDAGHCLWDRGDPHLNTAFAAAALLTAGHAGDVTERAVDYLMAEQDPQRGAWHMGAFFGGRINDDMFSFWVSPALTTAIALEALMKHQILALAADTATAALGG